MDCSNPTPRVGYPQLKSFINQRVLFVGKVESLSPGCAHMLAPDGSKVVVQTNSTYNSMFVEVEGVVVDPSTIREEAHVDMNETFGGSPHAAAAAGGGWRRSSRSGSSSSRRG
jgi:hypothetical protein